VYIALRNIKTVSCIKFTDSRWNVLERNDTSAMIDLSLSCSNIYGEEFHPPVSDRVENSKMQLGSRINVILLFIDFNLPASSKMKIQLHSVITTSVCAASRL
jgi:hypothetical protein